MSFWLVMSSDFKQALCVEIKELYYSIFKKPFFEQKIQPLTIMVKISERVMKIGVIFRYFDFKGPKEITHEIVSQ